MSAKKAFYITTAISYVNGVPHLGHAYEAILTDVMARFQRLDGRDVFFLTGTDEHGEKVAKTAQKNNMQPKEFADINAASFLEMTGLLDISQDDFIRTTEGRHYEASKAMWQKLQENGDIYLGKYEGWYSMREEAYFATDELQTDAATGLRLSPNGTEVEWVEESSYFFRLSAYTDKLLEYYEAHPEFIQPQARRNEVISFVRQGLKDLSVSRHKKRLQWGIPVPGDDDHVMYVWLDALTNYVTGVGYPDTRSAAFEKFWPADFHVIGKDIIRFHTVYWPAFLMSAGLDIPHTVFAHGFINISGQKMSKSVGNVLSPEVLVKTYGLDAMRYFLMREIPHGQDGNFGHEQAVNRINADLANGLGNLAQRTLSMIHKNCDAKIPAPGPLTPQDEAILENARTSMISDVRVSARTFQFHRALERIWQVVAEANAYIDEQAPWALRKTDLPRMETVLYVLSEVIRCLGIAVQPFVPGSASRLLDQLMIPEGEREFSHLQARFALRAGTVIEKPEGVFPRLDFSEADEDSAIAGAGG